MSISVLKSDALLLNDLTKKYLDILELADKKQKKKIEFYLNSLLINLEKHVKENVKEINQNNGRNS